MILVLALKRTNSDMLMSMTDDEGVREAFEAAMIHMKTSALMISAIAKAIIQDGKIMKPVAKLVAPQVKMEVRMWRHRQW